MVLVPKPGPAGRTTRDPDRAAVLVAYTLLGAAINGFAPEAQVVLDPGGDLEAAAGFFPHCDRN
jgi:hypothetical protein